MPIYRGVVQPHPRQIPLQETTGSGLVISGSFPYWSNSVNKDYPFIWDANHIFNSGLQSASALNFIGSKSITTTDDGTLTIAPEVDLTFSPGGNVVKTTSDVQLKTDNYVSQATGWRIGYYGDGDFRYLFADEMHVKSFIADMEQALAGGQIICKSVAVVATDFTLPVAGGYVYFRVEDLPGATGMAVFEENDIICLRIFSRTSGSLQVANAWGVVSNYTDITNGTQSWKFTRSAAPNAGTASGTIAKGSLALDYGVSGMGFVETNAIDGLWGMNSPYSQVASWTTHPATGTLVRTRMGNLRGIFSSGSEYGLYAGNGVFTDSGSYLRISSSVVENHNVPLRLYSSSSRVIVLEPGANPYIAIGNPNPTSYLSSTGIWMGRNSSDGTYRMYAGSVVGGALKNGMTWDGTTLNVVGDLKLSNSTSGSIYGNANGWFGKSATNVPSFAFFNDNFTGTWGGFTNPGQGDIILGNNVSGSSAIVWDKSAGEFGFYGGGNSTAQVTINTSGCLTAGGGGIALGANGMAVHSDLGPSSAKSIQWYRTSTLLGGLEMEMTASNEYASFLTMADIAGATKRYMYLGLDVSAGPLMRLMKFASGCAIDLKVPTLDDYFTFSNNINTDGVTIYASGSIVSTGDMDLWGNYKVERNDTTYTGYIFVPLTAPLTSTSWDGDAFSSCTATSLNLSTVFGVPDNVKAVLMRVSARDSGGAGDYVVAFSPSNTSLACLECRPTGSDRWYEAQGIVPTVLSGTDAVCYYLITASGAGTMDIIADIWGYFI